MEENLVQDTIEKVEGEVINDVVEGSTEEAGKILLEVSSDLGDSMSMLAKGVAGLAIFGTATAIAGAGYGIYKGAKWLKGKMGSKTKKSGKNDAEVDQTNKVENPQAANNVPEDSNKDTSN